MTQRFQMQLTFDGGFFRHISADIPGDDLRTQHFEAFDRALLWASEKMLPTDRPISIAILSVVPLPSEVTIILPGRPDVML